MSLREPEFEFEGLPQPGVEFKGLGVKSQGFGSRGLDLDDAISRD